MPTTIWWVLALSHIGPARADPVLPVPEPAQTKPLACGAERYANDLLPFAEQGISITKALAVSNVASFCRATTRNQAEKDFSQFLSFTSDDDILSNAHSPWLNSYYPDEAVRREGYSNFGGFLPPTPAGLPVLDAARLYLQDPTPSGIDFAPLYYDTVSVAELDGAKDQSQLSKLSGFGVRTVALAAACNELVWGFECPGALDKVIDMSMPVQVAGLELTQPQLYKEILSDDDYDAGLRLAAVKLIDRVQGHQVAAADLFSDVKSSFLESGASPGKAEEMTWKTMGLIATGGANTISRMMHIRTPQSTSRRKMALSLLASLAPVLDSLSVASGHPYSYPSSIHSTCDTGKPYHFWLTAYLGWELARTGTSAKAAAAAAFLGNKGYQMMSNTDTRDPTRPLQEEFLSPYSNSIRMDLAAAAAGGIYGANAGKGNVTGNLDIDEGVRQTVLQSQPIDKLDEEQAKTLFASPLKYGLDWSKVMAPNAAFALYLPAVQ